MSVYPPSMTRTLEVDRPSLTPAAVITGWPRARAASRHPSKRQAHPDVSAGPRRAYVVVWIPLAYPLLDSSGGSLATGRSGIPLIRFPADPGAPSKPAPGVGSGAYPPRRHRRVGYRLYITHEATGWSRRAAAYVTWVLLPEARNRSKVRAGGLAERSIPAPGSGTQALVFGGFLANLQPRWRVQDGLEWRAIVTATRPPQGPLVAEGWMGPSGDTDLARSVGFGALRKRTRCADWEWDF